MNAPRLPEWFWPLIKSFKNDEKKIAAACRAMPRRRLIAFYRLFVDAAGRVNPQWWDDVEEQFGSEDVNKDFSYWVVTQGHDYYHQVRKHHHELKVHYARFFKTDRGFVDPRGIAGQVFYDRFEGEITLAVFPR